MGSARAFLRCFRPPLRWGKRHLWDPWRLWIQFPTAEFEAGATATSDCRFAEGVRVHADCVLARTRVGRHSFIAAGAHLRHCEVGAFCSIGPWVRAGLGRHPARGFVSTHPAFYSTAGQAGAAFVAENRFPESLEIRLGNDVWVGAQAFIADGVTVGDGAIVGAGAVVTKDVEPYAIVGGVPSRVLRMRFEPDDIQFLRQLEWWNRDEAWLRRYAPWFDDIRRLREALR